MMTPLFLKDWKSHWKTLAGFLALMTMYVVVIIGMYDPFNADLMQQLIGLKMSQRMLAAFGFTAPPPGLLGFVAGYLYGFLLIALPLGLLVFLSNRLVAALVDKGSMASLLAGPHTRRAVAGTQALFLLAVMGIVVAYVAGLGLVVSEARFPGMLNIPRYLLLNLALLLTLFAVTGVAFFASCLFNESRWALSLGAGLPLFFLVMQMLRNASPRAGWLKYLTLLSLFDPNALARGGSAWVEMAVLGAVGLLLWGGGIAVFHKKDLPL